MMPFEGGPMDQPYMTMKILSVVQSAYRKVASDERKALMEKARVKNHR